MMDQTDLNIDFEAITRLFTEAEQQDRDFLYEYETYQLPAGSSRPGGQASGRRGGRRRLYDPLVDELMDKGMAVFRSSDRAVQTLAIYIEGRLYAEHLRREEKTGFP